MTLQVCLLQWSAMRNTTVGSVTPDQPIDAFVSRSDPQATFTPENTYFRDDRVKQVVGIKLQLKGALGFAKPGMPARSRSIRLSMCAREVSRRIRCNIDSWMCCSGISM